MLIIQLIISLIPLIIINLFIKEKIKFKKILNLTFCTIITFIVLLIYNIFIVQVFEKFCNIFPILSKSAILLIFMQKLFYTGLPEEISKYSALKMSKPKNQKEILNNAIIISTIFMFYENYSYSQNNILLGIWRIILPIHIISQLIMSYWLIKAYDEKEKNIKKYRVFYVFSIILPIIIHTIYNCFISINGNVLIKTITILSAGIISYVIAFKFIKNMSEKYSSNNEENTIIIGKFKIITIVLFTIFWIYAFM